MHFLFQTATHERNEKFTTVIPDVRSGFAENKESIID